MSLHAQVTGQGCIQRHGYRFYRDGAISARVGFTVTREMVPRVKTLAMFAREDGELVADMIELPVCCEIESKVYVYTV